MIGSRIAICMGTNLVDGNPCTEPANGTCYCHKHDPSPEAKARRREIASRAGKAKNEMARQGNGRADADLPSVEVESIKDLQRILIQALNDRRSGRISREMYVDHVRACGALRANYVAFQLERRVEALEKFRRIRNWDNEEQLANMWAAKGAVVRRGSKTREL